MDQFGVLVESMGFKSQRSSAPMAHLRTEQNNNNNNFGFNNGFPQQPSLNSSKKPNVSEESFKADDLDLIFQSKKNNSSNSQRNYLDDSGIDFSGEPFANFDPTPEGPRGSIDLESVFDFSGSSRTASGSNSPPGRDASESAKGNAPQMVELIPGFGGSSPSSHDFGNNGIQVGANTSQRSTFSTDNDPFSVFETARSSTNDYSRSFSEASDQKAGRTSVESSIDELERFARSSTNDYSRSFSEASDQKAGRTSVLSSIDELERFAMGKVPDGGSDKPSEATLTDIRNTLNKDSKARVDRGVRKVHRQELLSEKRKEIHIDKVARKKNEALVSDSNIDNIFGVGNDSSHVNRPWTETKDPVFDALFNENQGPKVNNTASQAMEKSSSVTIAFDDFPFLFGDIPSSSGAFQEIEGESEERKRARWNQHIRTQERMAQALAEKNKRDSQSRYEQEEKRILWPECNWRPVSLTDLIAPTSVKKFYHKATLCVHPDKVQQKGSTLQQKIIAEKVFDILKEAWKKHNTQEPQSHLKMHF